MKSQLKYAAICADLIGRQSIKIGQYKNQPKISQDEFNKIKVQLLYINPRLKISKQQATILKNQKEENILIKTDAPKISISNFICRNDIKKICNKVEPGFDFRSEAKLLVEPLLKKSLKNILQICQHLLFVTKKKTLTEDICESATELLLTQELAEHATLYAQRALKMYKNQYEEVDSKGKSRSWKSDLILSVYKVKLNIDKTFKRSNDTASVYIAAVIEYILMELATLCVENTDSNIATKTLVEMVINNDEDLNQLFYPKKN